MSARRASRSGSGGRRRTAAPAPAPSPGTAARSVRPCRIGPLTVGPGQPPLLIAGPCVIEGREHALRHAERLRDIAAEAGFSFVYKSSFDKANRTSLRSFRGPGLSAGLKVLAEVRKKVGVPVLTDFHTEEQAARVGEVVDVLQVPAFLCRQTDLLVAAARTGKAVNVKKGQFLAPENMAPLVEKLAGSGCRDILLTERGVTFGYGHLVVDFRALPAMRRLGHPVIFDGTHSVQRPGGLGSKSGGDRTEVPALVRAAVAVGVDGLFLEVHEDPDHAPSDGPNMLALPTLAPLLATLRRVREAVGG
ncbi:MAG: 3-deoxy-8-phosphooctulonate synthase [Planctomycetia bacterium]